MIGSRDITYCVRDCENMNCERNKKHLGDGGNFYVSMSSFDNCKDYKDGSPKRPKTADELFAELGYTEKKEVLNIKREVVGFQYLNKDKYVYFNYDKKQIEVGVCQPISVAELKAMSKKVKELKWK